MIVLYWVKTWTCLQDHDLKDIHEMLPLNPTKCVSVGKVSTIGSQGYLATGVGGA